jgi:ABC-type multidrug transport system fused ATPase/permease subunit
MIRRLLNYAWRRKRSLGLVISLVLARVVVDLGRPWPAKIVVDYVLAARPLPTVLTLATRWLLGAGSPSGLLLWSVVLAILIVVLGAVLSLTVLRATITIAQRMVFDISRDLLEKLQRLSLSFHGRHAVGDLLQRVGGDTLVVHLAVSQLALPAIVAVLTLGGMFAIMARLDLVLTLVALAAVPVITAALVFCARPMIEASKHQHACQGALMALAEQVLSGVKLIQGFSREPYMQGKLESQLLELGEANRRSTQITAVYNELTALATGITSAIVLCLGGWRVLEGRITLGDLLVFLGYLAALYVPVTTLASSVGYGVALVARSRRVFEVLDSEEELHERPGALDLGRARGEIVFDRVTFGYRPLQDNGGGHDRPILRELSFRARPGQITAIVGATGAGKTTLISLISRFYDPWDGRVLIDGHDVSDVTLRSLRDNISLVLQEPYLFRMSVAENIAFGRPGATRAEIVEAARAAHAHDFIEQLPGGYDAMIFEKGSSLSGGERQRIAIARAILKDAPVLILDEPTSALDARTETKIFDALSRLMHRRTTFIISHRLSTIRRADQILALRDGRLVEQGTHESLIENDNLYAELYRHQQALTL